MAKKENLLIAFLFRLTSLQFYCNQPELALRYYRRLLQTGEQVRNCNTFALLRRRVLLTLFAALADHRDAESQPRTLSSPPPLHTSNGECSL
jgi:hypothetical protein